jgi:vancomycin resistance protein YoaR
MTKDELDSFGPKEQTKGVQSKASFARTSSPAPVPLPRSATSSRRSSARVLAPVATQRDPVRDAAPRPVGSRPDLGRLVSPFAVAFAVGAVAALFLVATVALGLSGAYSSKVLPGVRVGTVDVSGLSRDQVVAKLQSAYAYLGQGEVTVTTPVGATTITYEQINRGPDVQAMADAALSVGHTGSFVGDAASMVRSLVSGETVPVVVSVDPMALAARIHELVATSAVPAQNAQVSLKSGTFTFSPSASGRGIDEKAISTTIIDTLTQSTAPADLQAGGSFVSLQPSVNDADAQAAIAAAQKMVVGISLTWGGAWPAASATPAASGAIDSAAPAASQALIPSKTFTIPAATVRGWIIFGLRSDGSYGPAADPALVQAYLNSIAPKVKIAAIEPSVVTDSTGKPVSLKAGQDGVGIDVYTTAQSIEAYLDNLVSGGGDNSSITIAKALVAPQITSVDNLSGMVIIGSWTTTFYPGVSNGNGVNIRLPAKILNGLVISPGQQFSFFNDVGPIDAAHGWTMGGVILGGHSDFTGAIGGGVCSASTTMFNAAARAGLQIDERHAHFYYINRYPVGLDATVYSNGTEVWDLKWTNDTPYPIVIRGYSTYGSNSRVTIELWSLPLNRKVTFSGGVKTNQVTATDNPPQYVSTLKPGQQYRAEYPTDGFDTTVTRTVTDQAGNLIHTETWKSHYGMVNGQLQIGGTAPPSQTPAPSPGAPTPTPNPTPTAAPTTTPAPSPSARRRKVR